MRGPSDESTGGESNDKGSIGVENEEEDIDLNGNKIGESLDDVGTNNLHGTEFRGNVDPSEKGMEGTDGTSDMQKGSIGGKLTVKTKTKGEVPFRLLSKSARKRNAPSSYKFAFFK